VVHSIAITLLKVVLIVGFAVSLIGMGIFGLLTVMGRNPGQPLQPSWFESPFNYLFYPSRLTADGLRHRTLCFRFAWAFLFFVLCSILIFGT